MLVTREVREPFDKVFSGGVMSSDRFLQVSTSCEIESKDLRKRKLRSLLAVISLLSLMKQTGMFERALFTLGR